jgi:hypothetical protein
MRPRDYGKTPDGRKIPIRQLEFHELPKWLRDVCVPRDGFTDSMLALRGRLDAIIDVLEAQRAALDDELSDYLDQKLRERKK